MLEIHEVQKRGETLTYFNKTLKVRTCRYLDPPGHWCIGAGNVRDHTFNIKREGCG